MSKLTVARVRSLSKPGLHGDGGTLYLAVAPGGSKSWIQRLTVDGVRRDIGLGGFPLVTLAEARDRAFENRRLARRGGDPLADKRKARVPTFREAAVLTFEANRARWRHAKTATNWTGSMAKHAYPVFGDRRVDQIGREDVLRVLTPLWTKKPEMARKLRQRIRAVLAWAQAHGHAEHNFAGEAINGALPSMPAVKSHFRALPYQEIASALDTVEATGASMAAKLCLRFLILTAARSGEARGAAWAEIDEDARLWTIPAGRMKGGAEHRQPLSDAAMVVLDRARMIRDSSDLIFPSPMRRGRPLSDMSLTKLLRDTGLAERATVHGFRTSARTFWSERTNADHAVMELCLAHAVGSSVERAYARSDLLAKRRRLLDQWGRFVTETDAEVVKLHG